MCICTAAKDKGGFSSDSYNRKASVVKPEKFRGLGTNSRIPKVKYLRPIPQDLGAGNPWNL